MSKLLKRKVINILKIYLRQKLLKSQYKISNKPK